jgi:UDP-3-O-[3-hydroxymyristoyl] glucosamine N-acyltransferase
MRVDEIARLLKAEMQGDGALEIAGIAALETAGPEDLTFAEGERALLRAAGSRAACILIPQGAVVPGHTTLTVAHPKLALIRAAEVLAPPRRPSPGIHPTAVVETGVHLTADVSVGPQVVIEPEVTIGARTVLAAGVCLGRGVVVGEDCVLHPRVVVYAGARIGNRVVLHAGVVVGSDGFGYVFAEDKHHKFPQLGQVILGDDVEVGSNTTIDRGSLGVTMIGEGTKIDNLVQIAHNVKIGRHCVIAAQTGISGSAEIGDYVVLAGQVGVADRVRIEDRAVIGAQAGIPTGKVVRKGHTMWGTPARRLEDFKRQYAHLSNLPNLAKKVKELTASLREKQD